MRQPHLHTHTNLPGPNRPSGCSSVKPSPFLLKAVALVCLLPRKFPPGSGHVWPFLGPLLTAQVFLASSLSESGSVCRSPWDATPRGQGWCSLTPTPASSPGPVPGAQGAYQVFVESKERGGKEGKEGRKTRPLFSRNLARRPLEDNCPDAMG